MTNLELITAQGAKETAAVEAVLTELAEVKREADKAKKRYSEMTEKLKEAMAAHGIKKLDGEAWSVTYKEPTTKESFDGKAFRAAHPDLYDEYTYLSPVSDSILIKVK